jgi:cytochrome c-type biogenesis protein CcmH/NrfG
MPCHFGAWAGMGHCHAHVGRFKDALAAYRKALAINPHLECLTEACAELERQTDPE